MHTLFELPFMYASVRSKAETSRETNRRTSMQISFVILSFRHSEINTNNYHHSVTNNNYFWDTVIKLYKYIYLKHKTMLMKKKLYSRWRIT